MNSVDLIQNPDILLDQKIGGLNILKCIDSNDNSVWYEGREDAGEKRLVYVYTDKCFRDKDRNKIYGFRTTDDLSISTGRRDLNIFIIIGEHRVVMDRQLRNYFSDHDKRPKEINGFELLDKLGHGYKGVTFRVRRKNGTAKSYALKLTIADEYSGGSCLPECDRMNELFERDRDHFVSIDSYGKWSCKINGDDKEFIYFVEDFISGTTLEKFLERSRSSLDAHFLDKFIREMLSALTVMHESDLMHDDLHSGNILLYDSKATHYRPYLIDLGSAKERGVTEKGRDDIRNLAGHIATILNIITSRQESRSECEDRIISACEALLSMMNDEDPLRRPDDPKRLLVSFDENFPRGPVKQKLKQPFDFGNAEEVLDNTLLHELAAEHFPWKEKIEESGNLLVIGPRGSGKTHVFRSMSFKCLADAGQIETALNKSYFGLYISCNREFRQRFSSLTTECLRSRGEEIRHYFNLLVIREFIGVLKSCEESNKLIESDLRSFQSFVVSKISWDISSFSNSKTFLSELESMAIRSINSTRMSIWDNQELTQKTDQGFIADLAILAGQKISSLQGKVLYLFVDDYTEPKVPREAQRSLNHILFVPNGVYKSKISSEIFGLIPDQTFGSFLDQSRDYKEYNLGTLFYTNLPSSEQKNFLQEVIDKRLMLCGYAGKVCDIIGPSSYPNGTLARAIKEEFIARNEFKKNDDKKESD
ncbi:hypothetical protein HY605_05245, partial [Candidatus Peregrinibacteria bacterium]|nr:hypothetical protein [Candidatus Peregrinibacteria bacterium]